MAVAISKKRCLATLMCKLTPKGENTFSLHKMNFGSEKARRGRDEAWKAKGQ